MPEILALIGLVLATVLYASLVRRRSFMRFGIESMSRALHASNEIALSRLRTGFRPEPAAKPEKKNGDWRDGITVVDRRSGEDRRRWDDRRRGRGRRAGGDRRRDGLST